MIGYFLLHYYARAAASIVSARRSTSATEVKGAALAMNKNRGAFSGMSKYPASIPFCRCEPGFPGESSGQGSGRFQPTPRQPAPRSLPDRELLLNAPKRMAAIPVLSQPTRFRTNRQPFTSGSVIQAQWHNGIGILRSANYSSTPPIHSVAVRRAGYCGAFGHAG